MQQPVKIIQWLSANKLKIELVLVTLVGASVFMNYYRVEGGSTSLLIAMSLLATFYFYSAYLTPEFTNAFALIARNVNSIASSVCVVGLLFTILKLNGAAQMLLIGSLSIGAAGLIILFFWITSKDKNYIPILIRVVVLGGVSGLTLMEIMKQNA